MVALIFITYESLFYLGMNALYITTTILKRLKHTVTFRYQPQNGDTTFITENMGNSGRSEQCVTSWHTVDSESKQHPNISILFKAWKCQEGQDWRESSGDAV